MSDLAEEKNDPFDESEEGTEAQESSEGHVQILNLNKSDPFAEPQKGGGAHEGFIHIRIQQRNGRKTLTTVQGISEDYDKKKLVKAFKKEFACNGTVVDHPEYGEVIQLQGDQRNHICEFLTNVGLANKDQIKMHGF